MISVKHWILGIAIFLAIGDYLFPQEHISCELLDSSCQLVPKNVVVDHQVGTIILNQNTVFQSFRIHPFAVIEQSRDFLSSENQVLVACDHVNNLVVVYQFPAEDIM